MRTSGFAGPANGQGVSLRRPRSSASMAGCLNFSRTCRRRSRPGFLLPILRRRCASKLLWDLAPASRSFAVAGGTPPARADLAAQAGAMRSQSAEEKRELLSNFLSSPEDASNDGTAFFARALLQPYAELLAAAYPRWRRDGQLDLLCVPGEAPGRVLHPEGDGGKRFLLCSFCASEWEFRRVLCPTCGEADYQKLPRFSARGHRIRPGGGVRHLSLLHQIHRHDR